MHSKHEHNKNENVFDVSDIIFGKNGLMSICDHVIDAIEKLNFLHDKNIQHFTDKYDKFTNMIQKGPQCGAAKNWWMAIHGKDGGEHAPILPPKMKISQQSVNVNNNNNNNNNSNDNRCCVWCRCSLL